MAIYSCKGCNRCLNLSDEYQLNPGSQQFEAGSKGTISFSAVDERDFRQKGQTQCFPCLHSRRRSKLTCVACGNRVGDSYKDGATIESTKGQAGLASTETIPPQRRYLLKRDSLRISGHVE